MRKKISLLCPDIKGRLMSDVVICKKWRHFRELPKFEYFLQECTGKMGLSKSLSLLSYFYNL